jgi:hypothetical protein
MDSSSDRQMMLANPSLLGAKVATDVFGLSLLSYHSSNALVVMDQLPVKTMTYDLLLQCLIVVVTTAGSKLLSLSVLGPAVFSAY